MFEMINGLMGQACENNNTECPQKLYSETLVL